MLLVGPPMPDGSRSMTQMKRDTGPPSWGLGVGLTTPHRKNNLFQNLTISLGRMTNKC